MAKWVYLFSEGNKDMRDLLGGVGADLAEMTNVGLPVPPGFTVTTEACNAYFDAGKQFPEGMWDQVLEAMKAVEKQTGKKFGDPANPLLVYCRPGARVSMPGMMDTVGNIGLNSDTLRGMIELAGNERFVWDTYRRLIQMFGNIVKGVDRHKFEAILDEYKARTEGGKDTDLTTDMLKDVVKDFEALYRKELGEDFPDDAYEQMRQAIAAVFDSWFGAPAMSYRNVEGLPHDWGTGVNVHAAVFGNLGWDSGSIVAFTRNPSTGEKKVYGEFLLNAQLEDMDHGIRTPMGIERLQEVMPDIYEQLSQVVHQLEVQYRDVRDIKATFERGRLWLLKTRRAKRTAYASLRFAIDFLEENLISEEEAIFCVQPNHLGWIFAPKLPPNLDKQPIAVGLNASPGCASGIAIFDADKAEELGKVGKEVILIRPVIMPEDIHGIVQSQGVITSMGGMTSHAAVIARGFKMPCVGGAAIEIDTELRLFHTSGEVVREGDVITIDGTSGAIYWGEIPLVSVGLQDDPYLMRYASLVWAANSDDYVEDGVGTLWLLRDTIRDKSVAGVLSPISRSSGSSTELTRSEVEDVKYVSFIQPPDVVIRDVLNTMHWHHNDPDTVAVVWGIMDNLVRLLQNEVGIGNHHLAIRPLVAPEWSLTNPEIQSVDSSTGDSSVQLVGIEFFGINRLLRNYLPWWCVQCWAIVRFYHLEYEPYWRLDRINPRGESLIPGSRELVGFLVVLNDRCLTTTEARRFYNELRKRELGWDWYKENNTSWREVVGTLQCVQTGQPTDQTMLTKYQTVGLLTQDFQLSSAGLSLLCDQTAAERRHITFSGRELRDE
jgi:phosphohistidine swiveling domain-containing protein